MATLPGSAVTGVGPGAALSLRRVLPPWLLLALALMSLGCALLPQVDLACSRAFTVGGVFPSEGHWLFDAASRVLTYAGRAAGLALALAAVGGFLPCVLQSAAGQWLRQRHRPIVYLFVSLAVGPGLLVNYGFKDTFHRARPAEVTEFGGSRQFTPAFVPSDQCRRNCSFVSGETAGSTFGVAGFFLARSRRARRAWLAGGLGVGAAVGLLRIAGGHHFLSDVLVAMASSYVVLALCALWLLRPRR